VQSGITFVDV